ncbi:alpha-L-rhamnosidase [Microbacterium hydrocarbonoxydans]|uniref:alpha-L-rhamnosidase n=1 Tax=Microbacterium hydrocarbonoxydans TaxID=273678 RepID=A0A1H4JIV9_9MICO|nr:alpha-L-rhamnosidase [Microbacterium hydrocarbonoxydans]SEB45975.1 alpha-L-rhamnosidase [Microbacterium hydrocarbonoxydans]
MTTATFITPVTPSGREGDPAPYFRRDFTASAGLQRATLRVTAIGLVEAWLNGARVGDEVLAPGWTSYRHRLAVSSHDVTSLIREGENALGAIVGEGWALGRLGWENRRNHYSDRPALWAELVLEYVDRVETIGTDDSFRVSSGAIRSASIYDGEIVDARQEPMGWSAPGFDESSWGPVEGLDWPVESLIERTAEPIRRVEELVPVEVLTSPSGRTVVDFGQNISGWVRFTVSASTGDVITLRHAEVLTNGDLDYETIRTARATDVYTARGDVSETFEPRFTFHGFRYVDIEGWPGQPSPDDLRAIVVHSDMTRTGWFETSSPLVNRLHENVVWSMRDNFVGVPTDCPQRDERLGWTGDLNAFAPTAAFLYDVRGVLGSWLEDLSAEQEEKGFVPWVVPDVLSTPSSPTALWSDVAVSLPWVLYQEYGDPEILRRAYPSMTAFIRSVESSLDEHGLWSSGFQYGDWLDPDAPSDNPAGGKTDRHLVASAYLCKTTRELADTAALLGEEADAAHFAALADRVRAAFRREYVTAAGRIVNESATAYALAIVFDILDAEQRKHAGDQLANLVAKAGFRISTGFAGTPLVTDALSSTGHLDEAYALLTETQCPSFLYPVTMGATTIWERWDSIRPDGTINPSGMTSLNHYALGAVASWLHRVVGGIEATEPGYRRIRIAPRPGGGLTSAKTGHTTVRGEIAVSWRHENGEMAVDVVVPEGADAEVVLPLHPDSLAETVGAGSHSWRYEVPVAQRAEYSMDTSLNVLAADPVVWRDVTAVFAEHLPGIPIDGTAPEAAVMSLDIVLGYIPGASDELRADLERAVTDSNTRGVHA